MEVLVWLLNLQVSSHLVESWNSIQVIDGENLAHVLWLHSLLQVLLTIERTCLDKAITVIRTAQESNICRECATISANDYLPHLEVC